MSSPSQSGTRTYHVTRNDIFSHQSTSNIDLIMTSVSPSRATDSRTGHHVTTGDQSRFQQADERRRDWSTSRA